MSRTSTTLDFLRDQLANKERRYDTLGQIVSTHKRAKEYAAAEAALDRQIQLHEE